MEPGIRQQFERLDRRISETQKLEDALDDIKKDLRYLKGRVTRLEKAAKE